MNKLGYLCIDCNKEYKSYTTLWNHNRIKHDSIKTKKSERPAPTVDKENNYDLFKCRNCTKTYKHKQSRYTHEKTCSGNCIELEIDNKRIIESDNKKIAVLEKENENIELHIKLQELKNVEIVNKRVIFQRRELCPDMNVVPVTIEKTSTEHFIYILREREFLTNNDNVYKIGRSSMSNCTRMKSYPKGSQIVSINSCIDSIKFEHILIQLFKYKFIQETAYGTEYFRGDIMEMKNAILKLLLDESKGYSNGGNIASLQLDIDNNKGLNVGKLSCKEILELKGLLQEKIIEIADREW